MALLEFGQPDRGVMQMAWVVPDIHQAIDHWVDTLRVGPWFLLERFTGENPVYRGQPARSGVALAMSFAGHMNVELIQPLDDHPSVYREWIERHGHGFHHWGVASRDVEADLRQYRERGFSEVFRAGVPTGGEVVYLEGGGQLPGYVELIPVNPQMERGFSAFYAATMAWDGSQRVRPFAPPG